MTIDTTTSQSELKDSHTQIDQWYTESFTSLPVGRDSDSRRHGFFVNDIGLLLPNNLNCEVTENKQVCKLPNSADWFSGMTNLRGNIIPIFDLGILFRLPEKNLRSRPESFTKKQLFLEIENNWAGFYSDGLPLRIMLNKSHLLETIPPAPAELEPFIFQSYKQKNIWFDLNIKDLLLWITSRF